MSTHDAPPPGAGAEERPAWFIEYLQSLSAKQEEVQVEAIENVLNQCDDISEVFKNNISAAYRSEAQQEVAPQSDREALNQQLLCTPVLYSAPYVQFPWDSIGAEQAKLCSKINDLLIPLDFASKSLKYWTQHFDVIYNHKFITSRISRIAIVFNSAACLSNSKYCPWMLAPEPCRMILHLKIFFKLLACFATRPIIRNKLSSNCMPESTKPAETALQHTWRKFKTLLRMHTGSLLPGRLIKRLWFYKKLSPVQEVKNYLN